jgi:ubiquinone/menaquinone biosynthesis C-methylase UbiE
MLAKEHLIPPGELILENGIGSTDRSDIAKVRQEFADVGDNIAKGLVSQASLKPDSQILDVGCGLGRVARGFVDFIGRKGSYTGIDIVPSSIKWCKSAFAKYQNFSFVHADVFSKFYNPKGLQQAEKYMFPFACNSYDFVYSMSLFTHLLVDAADNYLGEMGRVAKPGALLVNTFFILDEVSTPLANGFYEVPGGRIQTPESPEAVSAIYLDRLKEIHEKRALDIEVLGFGHWTGRPDAQAGSFQDCIVARKRR